MLETLERMSMYGPQRQDFDASARQNKVAPYGGADSVQQYCAVDGFRPRFNHRQLKRSPLAIGISAPATGRFYLSIKRFQANSKRFGSRLTLAFVFNRRQLGEPSNFGIRITTLVPDENISIQLVVVSCILGENTKINLTQNVHAVNVSKMTLGGSPNFLFRFLTKAVVRWNVLLRPIERRSKAVEAIAFFCANCDLALPLGKL